MSCAHFVPCGGGCIASFGACITSNGFPGSTCEATAGTTLGRSSVLNVGRTLDYSTKKGVLWHNVSCMVLLSLSIRIAVDSIQIRGARTHNLKNIHLDLPRDQLIVITGLSGSGKSSLAFDTLYAEAIFFFLYFDLCIATANKQKLK